MDIVSLYRKSPFSFLLTVLSMLFFIGMVWFSILYMRHFHWVNVLIFALPLLLFGLTFILRAFDKIGKSNTIIINIILIVILSTVMLFNGIYMLFADFTEHTTNVREYEKVLRIYGYPYSKNIRHFPKEIPHDAKNISFWENPQFLQGGSRVLLMYNTTSKELEEYRVKYSEQAQIVLPPGKKEHVTDKYCITSIRVMKDKELDDNFEVIILESTPFGNHGYTYGLAINAITNEILFFSEVW